MQALKKHLFFFFCGLGLALVCATGTHSEPAAGDWNGFQVDVSRINAEQRQSLAPSILEQLRIITSVDLPPAMLAFFRTVPIVVDASYVAQSRALFQGRGQGGYGEIHAGLKPLDPGKPVLLHEMMHAYDAQYWHNAKPEVNTAYQQALAENLYPRESHFMHNQGEFFAISSTVYLYGNIAQVPHDCRTLAARQAQYLRFLADVFGRHALCD
ncbi:MAG: hypothetical protein WCK81_13610 [Betaproteobacteria bacterium]